MRLVVSGEQSGARARGERKRRERGEEKSDRREARYSYQFWITA
jgi:hypothetical protein